MSSSSVHCCRVLISVSVASLSWKALGMSSAAAESIRDSDWGPLTGLENGMIFHCFLVIRGQK